MNQKQILKIFQVDDLNDLPSAISKVLDLSISERSTIFQQLLECNNFDLSYDWFQSAYETELSQRSQNKQDFTPNSVGVLLSNITGVEKGGIYEPTAGNGSLIIANWNHRKTILGENYVPTEHPVECWELSARSIPILLLNLSIRGIVGIVRHGDVLEKQIKEEYHLKPINDLHYQFTEIVKIKY